MPPPNTTAQSIPAIRLGKLLSIFKDSYVSHLLIPSLVIFLLMKLSSSSEPAGVAVLLVTSALWVSAAHRVFTGGHLFSELSVRRAIFRAVVIVAVIGIIISLTIAVVAPVLFFVFWQWESALPRS